ncbi:molybdenum cofactor guanylyltransferase [Desmospora activa]|uniref:Probable molybdenum cofactor guanylyltransferase n=1 Tax=Desmospora activa DSM 45169 TaxID=1121389 RepID=A0A2T4Z8G4_9BACL|nr:molybdenum cofactor guanylyltransferase [Desmospora activa]PTM58177.1 molybdenum cofactor guanylyltransferase [Desmospora activa DSM 45169]
MSGLRIGFKGTLILLAGGASRRMGTDKAMLDFGGEPLACRIIRRLCASGEWEPLIVSNNIVRFASWGWPTVTDRWPGAGPLAGVCSGLQASAHDWNLVVACDMPFASLELATALQQRAVDTSVDISIPQRLGRRHPLFGCYHRRCLPVAERLVKSGQRSMGALLAAVAVTVLEETDFPPAVQSERALFNMNRPQDYEQALEWDRYEGRVKKEDLW